MEQPAASDRFDELLAHRAWVRRVARALVLDESRAEDLEQETWIRALGASPPRFPRAWLATVLRNAAVNLRLAESRRSAYEAAVLPPPGEATPAELLERAEIVERVARAVRTLEEPYRTAILLRYFEDLSVAAVAGRLGVPLETVRTRLRRALVLLRERLDREHRGDRRKWVLLLLPLARRPAPAGTGAGLTAGILGGLAMTLKAKAVIAAAVVLVLLGGGVWWSRSGDGARHEGKAPPAAPFSGAAPVVAAAPKAPAPAPLPVLPPPAVHRPILVLDPDGRPAAGAAVESLRVVAGGVDEARPVPGTLGQTDAEGRIPWPEGETAFPCVVRAIWKDLAPGEAVAVSRDAEVVVRLRRGCFLEGQVEAPDGAPVEGASVRATVLPLGHVLGNQLGVTGSWVREVKSGTDGRFRIEGLPPSATGLVSARAEGFMEARVAWRPMEPGPLRIVLERPFSAIVRVRDRAGKGVEGASVWVFQGPRLKLGRWMQVEPEVLPLPPSGPGDYSRDDLPAGWYWLLVAAKGYRLVVDEGAALGRTQGPVEVVLEETPGLRGRVVWYETKEPVAGVRIRATPLRKVPPTAGGEQAQAYFWPVSEMDGPFVTTTGPDGTYELPVFGPSDRFRVEARGEDGSRGFVGHPPYPKTESPELGDIWLHRVLKAVDYTGRVVSDTGEPIQGAIVVGISAVVTTGPDGKFRLIGRQYGTHLQFLAPGFIPRTRFAPGTTPTGGGDGPQDFGDVALARLQEIRGSVVDAAGKPVPGLCVSAEPADRNDLKVLFKEYEFTSASSMTDAEGGVALRVVPGYRYRVHPWDFDGISRGSVEVAGDGGEEFRLVVGPDPRSGKGAIRGRLRLEDGTWRPCRVTVGLRPELGGSSGGLSGAVDPEGAFAIPGVPAGPWALRVSGSEDVAGELAGVAIPAGGTAEVEIPCRWLRKETDALVEVAIRLDPLPERPETLKAWATRQPSGESEPLALQPDGAWKGRARTGAPYCFLACDAKGMRAGVLTGPPAGEGKPVTVKMDLAGLLFPPGWEHGTPEPWVEVRDGSGAVLYSGGQSGLPVVPDHGYGLVLPPGEYRIEVSVGAERKGPKSFTATAVAGTAKRIE